jgi:hypothetical protein
VLLCGRRPSSRLSAAGALSVLDDYRVTPAPALLDASHQVIQAVDGCEAIVAATGQ